MNKAVDEGRGAHERHGASMPPSAGAAARRPAGGSAFHVYKPGQGAYVRWGSAAAAGIVVVGAAMFLREQLTLAQSEWIQMLVPVVLLVVGGYLSFRFIGQSRSVVDFMIATEGEMKKVNWSSRREVLGATKVVIVTVIALGSVLFAVNILFMFVFESIGVLRIGMLAKIFGGRPE